MTKTLLHLSISNKCEASISRITATITGLHLDTDLIDTSNDEIISRFSVIGGIPLRTTETVDLFERRIKKYRITPLTISGGLESDSFFHTPILVNNPTYREQFGHFALTASRVMYELIEPPMRRIIRLASDSRDTQPQCHLVAANQN